MAFGPAGLAAGGAAIGGPIGLGVGAGIAGLDALLGFFGGHSEAKRQEELRKQLMQLFSTQNLSDQTNNLFALIQRSPMYASLRAGAMGGSTNLANQLQTSYARAGLSNTGLAASALPLARSGFSRQFMGIDADLFMKALSGASGLIGQQAGALTGTAGPKGWEIGMGNTLQSLQPLLLNYFMNRNGGVS
jgi:hypothetical protein